MKTLDQKVALVTGGASGIGLAIVKAYLKEGAKVMLSDIDPIKGQKIVDDLKSKGAQVAFFKADCSLAKDNEDLVNKTIEVFGKLDIACNNAGIAGEANLTEDYSLDSWKKVIDINLNGVFYGCKYQLKAMQKNGYGVIVNMASIHGSVAAPLSSAYTTAKHAVVGLTKNIAVEYASKGIRCNSVGPGYIDTPLLAHIPIEQRNALIAKHPIGRLGKAEEVAELVLFLSSEKASFITGGYYLVDGGYTAI
ncbi:SDR family NAD(P)-dependent oxidoreductase [Myroides sp. LJL116]